MSEEQNKPADAEIDQTAAPEAAEDRVATLEAEVASLKDQLLRAVAETENTRRRAQRDREDASKYAVSSFAKELVTVADNLRRALDAVPAEGREQDEMLKGLAVGVEATERQLFAAFDRAGIKRIDPTGDMFDPNFHQVMFEIENTGKAAGTVVQVLQPGYTIHGRLLREAMVGVAKASANEAGGQHVNTTA
ncbi:nucleotide exchange factor GrpE [Azospirillum cavernae]|uniref:Protein GrpE n=1 Tax=Azospirillum cavernae TaxID=2320860 RepID=A0A418VWC1_9PROT|nr:nucleotide exchange factor GrpE [Azospirillum cavernae]